jgi:hypothetical protein
MERKGKKDKGNEGKEGKGKKRKRKRDSEKEIERDGKICIYVQLIQEEKYSEYTALQY